MSLLKPNLVGISSAFSSISPCGTVAHSVSFHHFAPNVFLPSSSKSQLRNCLICHASSRNTGPAPDKNSSCNLNSKAKKEKSRIHESKINQDEDKDPKSTFPQTIPKKPKRGRRSEAAAVEDYVRDSLERTFASIREQNSEILKGMDGIMKDRADDDSITDQSAEDEDSDNHDGEKKMVVDDEDPNWPLDADVGWGIRASEYFEQHPIKNVTGEDGVEIDWEGEIEEGWVKEINCLEWESFAFHPSPLIVLVFERYNRQVDGFCWCCTLLSLEHVFYETQSTVDSRLYCISFVFPTN